jgi:hypothetical protein
MLGEARRKGPNPRRHEETGVRVAHAVQVQDMGQDVGMTSRGRMLPPSWPLWPFPLLLCLWLLGMNYLIWPLIGCAIVVGLVMRREVRVPRGFGIWMLFLGWLVISGTQLSGVDRAFSYLYRFSMYFSATALFLYVYNSSRRELPSRTIVNFVALGWCMVTLGGLIGLAAKGLSLHSPLELVLPKGLLDIGLVRDMVTPTFAKEQAFVGLGLHRTQAPFPYPNAWGSNFVLLTPFALWSLFRMARRQWRPWLLLLLALSIVPLFFSLDRGAWLALVLAAVYAACRLMLSLDVRAIRWFAAAGAVLAFVVLFTPMGQILVGRVDHGYSDEGRVGRNIVAVELAQDRPLLGYGAPQSSEYNPGNAAVGTHGQLWLVLVSQGFPGVVFYMGWLVWLLFRSGRRLRSVDDFRFWPHLVFFCAIVMTPYYELLPLQLHTIMIAAALVLRDGWARPASAEPVPEQVEIPAEVVGR